MENKQQRILYFDYESHELAPTNEAILDCQSIGIDIKPIAIKPITLIECFFTVPTLYFKNEFSHHFNTYPIDGFEVEKCYIEEKRHTDEYGKTSVILSPSATFYKFFDDEKIYKAKWLSVTPPVTMTKKAEEEMGIQKVESKKESDFKLSKNAENILDTYICKIEEFNEQIETEKKSLINQKIKTLEAVLNTNILEI